MQKYEFVTKDKYKKQQEPLVKKEMPMLV